MPSKAKSDPTPAEPVTTTFTTFLIADGDDSVKVGLNWNRTFVEIEQAGESFCVTAPAARALAKALIAVADQLAKEADDAR